MYTCIVAAVLAPHWVNFSVPFIWATFLAFQIVTTSFQQFLRPHLQPHRFICIVVTVAGRQMLTISVYIYLYNNSCGLIGNRTRLYGTVVVTPKYKSTNAHTSLNMRNGCVLAIPCEHSRTLNTNTRVNNGDGKTN